MQTELLGDWFAVNVGNWPNPRTSKDHHLKEHSEKWENILKLAERMLFPNETAQALPVVTGFAVYRGAISAS